MVRSAKRVLGLDIGFFGSLSTSANSRAKWINDGVFLQDKIEPVCLPNEPMLLELL